MPDLYFTVLKLEENDEGVKSFMFYAVPGYFGITKFDEIPEIDPREFTKMNFRFNGQIAVIKCSHGWIEDLQVFQESLGNVERSVDARRCGIGTVLTELCLIDPDVNIPKPGNMALDILSTNRNAANEFEMVKNKCQKLVGLMMAAEVKDSEFPHAGGRTYFTAAINMRYRILVIDSTFYSDESRNALNVYDVKTAKENFDPRTGNINPCCNHELCVAHQSYWLFCFEK